MEDNVIRELPVLQRMSLETELGYRNMNDHVFTISSLNYVRNCIDGNVVSSAFYQALTSATRNEAVNFVKVLF